jgi:hypothetical protein
VIISQPQVGFILIQMTNTQKTSPKSRSLFKQIAAPLVPYITVGIGLLVFHNAWIAIISYHLCMILILLLAGTGRPLRDFFKTTNVRVSLTAIGLGAAGGTLLYLLWPLLAVPVDISLYLENIGLTQFSWPLFLAYHILVNPWIEEYYWRGYLGSDLKRIVINDLFFSGYHILILAGKMDLLWLIACFIILSGTAWFWRQATRLSQGLLSSTASHLAADLTVMLAIYIMTGAG